MEKRRDSQGIFEERFGDILKEICQETFEEAFGEVSKKIFLKDS